MSHVVSYDKVKTVRLILVMTKDRVVREASFRTTIESEETEETLNINGDLTLDPRMSEAARQALELLDSVWDVSQTELDNPQ